MKIYDYLGTIALGAFFVALFFWWAIIIPVAFCSIAGLMLFLWLVGTVADWIDWFWRKIRRIRAPPAQP